MSSITRKCVVCKQPIVINEYDIKNVVYYKGAYYHSHCFCDHCEAKAKSKRGKPEEWQNALNDLWVIESETQKKLKDTFDKDAINNYLLEHYNIALVPKRFWTMLADLNNGVYKGKRCKEIYTNTLLDIWKWGQKNLDKIATNNKTKHIGPKNDSDRIFYDLAILMNKVPNYLKHKKQIEIIQIEQKQRTNDNIEYDKIKTQHKSNGLDDISSLIDDLL